MALDLDDAHEPNSKTSTSRQETIFNNFFMVFYYFGANVIFFQKRDTILRKKAFLCRYETLETTPININSAPAPTAWMPKIS
jgi:hypothetical protein